MATNGSVNLPAVNLSTAVGNLPGTMGVRSVGCQINGGGSVITTGLKAFVIVPYGGTIIGWALVADQSGSIVVDVWKKAIGSAPGTVADTIAGSDLPTLSSQIQKVDTTLTGWGNTAVTANDVIYFNVNSAATLTQVNVILKIQGS